MKPILFNTEMVKAILDGRKTVTRRVIKPRYREDEYGFQVVHNKDWSYWYVEKMDEWEGGFDDTRYVKPPYQVGDVLYVRERFCIGKIAYREEPDGRAVPYVSQCIGDRDFIPYEIPYEYCLQHDIGIEDVIWKPSIHMPKEAARIFLRVTAVRPELLQDIKAGSVYAEGIEWKGERTVREAIGRFINLWNSTIPKKDLEQYGWDANPWVWVIEFERTERSEA